MKTKKSVFGVAEKLETVRAPQAYLLARGKSG